MRSLILFRHAKAAPASPGQRDFERTLTDRGRRDAALMGRALAKTPIEIAFVSAAARTRETWDIAAAELKTPPHAEIDQNLYLSGAEKLIDHLRTLPNSAQNVLVVGHNPDMQEVALWLAGDAKGRAAREMHKKFPTAALAIFRFELASWDKIGPERATLERFATPDDIAIQGN